MAVFACVLSTPLSFSGEMAISEAAELFDKLFLKSLRQECGGLQTALKNWSQVFAGELSLSTSDTQSTKSIFVLLIWGTYFGPLKPHGKMWVSFLFCCCEKKMESQEFRWDCEVVSTFAELSTLCGQRLQRVAERKLLFGVVV